MNTSNIVKGMFGRSRDRLFSEAGLSALLGCDKANWHVRLLQMLIDNALDSCEEFTIKPVISITQDAHSLSVEHNGPPIDEETLKTALMQLPDHADWRTYRGGLSRAPAGLPLLPLLAASFLNGDTRGVVKIACNSERHQFTATRDEASGEILIDHSVEPSPVFAGISVRILYPAQAQVDSAFFPHQFSHQFDVICTTAAVNPHVKFNYQDVRGEKANFLPIGDPLWKKWGAEQKLPPHWYPVERLQRLAIDMAHTNPLLKFQQFLWASLSLGSLERLVDILCHARIDHLTLADFAKLDLMQRVILLRVLTELKRVEPFMIPQALGIIGAPHFELWLGENSDCYDDTGFSLPPAYGMTQGFDATGAPFVLELAMGQSAQPRTITMGLNFSGYLVNPIHELEGMLDAAGIDATRHTAIVGHFACPFISFTDSTQHRVVLPAEVLRALKDLVEVVAPRMCLLVQASNDDTDWHNEEEGD